MAAYPGWLPTDFDADTARALSMAIPAVEARHALAVARGIGAAFGGGKAMAALVYEATGSAEQACAVEAAAFLARVANGR